jgi:hypothetical protein
VRSSTQRPSSAGGVSRGQVRSFGHEPSMTGGVVAGDEPCFFTKSSTSTTIFGRASRSWMRRRRPPAKLAECGGGPWHWLLGEVIRAWGLILPLSAPFYKRLSLCVFHRGYSLSLFGFFGLTAPGLRFRGTARKPPRKPQKGPLRIWPAMKNTLCETGVDVGIRVLWSESAIPRLGRVFRAPVEPTRGTCESRWKDPAASRRIIRQLMAMVNSCQEYETLRRDLAELDRSCSSSSSIMKGGAAPNADNETWLR